MTLESTSPPEIEGEVTIVVPPQMVNAIANAEGNDIGVIKAKAKEYLNLGYLAAQAVGVSVSTAAMDQTIETGADNLSKIVDDSSDTLLTGLSEAKVEFGQLMEESIGADDSDLQKKIDKVFDDLEIKFKEMADPQAKGSLAYNVTDAAITSVDQAKSQIDTAFDLGLPESMASKLVNTMDARFLAFHKALSEMKANIEAEQAKVILAMGVKELKATHPTKGDDFEGEVSPELKSIAGLYGDVATDIGTKTDGIGKSKNGDHLSVVMLASVEAGRIAFEDKAGKIKLSGKDSIQTELEDAMTDNNATVSVAIVDSEFAPKLLLKHGILVPQPNMYILAVDRQAGDFRSLAFLYKLIRLQIIAAYMQEQSKDEAIDPAIVEAICKGGISELATVNKLRKNLKSSSDTMLNIRKELGDLYSDMTERFEAILAEIAGGNS